MVCICAFNRYSTRHGITIIYIITPFVHLNLPPKVINDKANYEALDYYNRAMASIF